VRRAAGGDPRAWDALVRRHSGLLWATARSCGLAPEDAAEVVQTAWLRLVEHLHRIRDPERLGAWLATTVRREAIRIRRAGEREVLVGEPERPWGDLPVEPPDAALLEDERRAAVRRALDRLPPRCGKLLRVLAADPTPSYADAAAALGIPIGSIGPTRGRCLECLRARLAAEGAGDRS
jgi:RNA polymerase sigma factor (sigma-70 family)